jgi:hypothetical protein
MMPIRQRFVLDAINYTSVPPALYAVRKPARLTSLDARSMIDGILVWTGDVVGISRSDHTIVHIRAKQPTSVSIMHQSV